MTRQHNHDLLLKAGYLLWSNGIMAHLDTSEKYKDLWDWWISYGYNELIKDQPSVDKP
jgi:hypothetical protein